MKRRDFFSKSISAAAAAAAMPYLLNGRTLRVVTSSPLLEAIAKANADNRVLVVVDLDGGNDGLNMVIPHEDPVYYNKRPTIGIRKSDALPLNATLGWNPAMTGFDQLYKEGKIALLQNVGYPNPNRSHFRSADIWNSGSDANVTLDTGWLGRYLDFRYPGYPQNAPASPLAIQIGSSLSLLLQGPAVGMGMALYDVETFYRLISGTDTSGGEEPPQTRAGDELRYIREIANEAQTYAKPIREVYNSVANQVTYPYNGATNLSDQLKIVARLIAGQYQGKNLETPVYFVRINGFDTHAGQTGNHANLLGALTGSIAAFLADCRQLGADDRVIVMTVSEFGRRVNENGTLGTDHGTCAPQFVVGNAVRGNVYGRDPDLTNLDPVGDMMFDIDFRQMYASVLEQWFGVPASSRTDIFNGKIISTLPIITQQTGVDRAGAAAAFALEQNYPNPFNPSTRIRFTVPGGMVEIKVFDDAGREVRTLVEERLSPGMHEVLFEAGGLASGAYHYRLRANGSALSRSMLLVK